MSTTWTSRTPATWYIMPNSENAQNPYNLVTMGDEHTLVQMGGVGGKMESFAMACTTSPVSEPNNPWRPTLTFKDGSGGSVTYMTDNDNPSNPNRGKPKPFVTVTDGPDGPDRPEFGTYWCDPKGVFHVNQDVPHSAAKGATGQCVKLDSSRFNTPEDLVATCTFTKK